MYVVTLLFNNVFLFNNNYDFLVKLSFNPKNYDIFRFVAKLKTSNLMFLPNIEEMADFSYQKLCFFYLIWQHWIHKTRDQDKHNTNTA